MSNTLTKVLGITALTLFGVYLALVVTTIYFASWQTKSASDIREIEGRIASLESRYYDSVEEINRMDPGVEGFVKPLAVRYVAEADGADLSLAGR